MSKIRKRTEVLEEFANSVTEHFVSNEHEIMEVNPQRLIALEDNFSYPEILEDYDSKRLMESIRINGWIDKLPDILGFNLLQLPNGYLIVDGSGNHRSAVSYYLKIDKVKANVSRIIQKR